MTITGGCQCGSVRYRAEGLGPANLCHCRMCQKAMGHPFAALVDGEGVVFEGLPARFRSSDVAERGFCTHCGTPLFYAPWGTEMIVLTTGSLDDPSAAPPTLHYGVDGQISWLHFDDGVPRKPIQPYGLSGKGPEAVTSHQHTPRQPEGITGGCQCGKVRFRASALGRSSICDCRMCQRAAGNVFAVLVTAHDVDWDGVPARFASSDIAERGFCRGCGTPLFYEGSPGQGLNIMPGALDDPELAPLALEYGAESRVAWVTLAHDLPVHETRPGGLNGTGPETIADYQYPAALGGGP